MRAPMFTWMRVFRRPPDPAASPLAPPPTPVATRLNRNALTVAAVVMGVTVLVAVVTLNTSTPTPRVSQDAPTTTPPAAAPSFLDRPPRGVVGPSEEPPPSSAATSPWSTGDTTAVTTMGSEAMPPGTNPYATPYAPPPGPTIDPAVEAYHRALRSPVLASVAATAPTATGASSTDLAPPHRALETDTTPTAMLRALAGLPPEAPTDASGRAAHAHAETPTTTGDGSRGLASTPQAALSRDASRGYQVDAGTVIPAALITAVNSDLPGPVLAQVTRTVYDARTQRIPLIPQGTKLLGQYHNTVTAGQRRLLIVWTQLVFPDGRRLTLPNFGTLDTQGATGVAGDVDQHRRQLFGNALLLTAIGAGIQLSQPRQGTVYASPTTGQIIGGAAGQQLGDVATELIRKQLDIPPTITLREGSAINVFVSTDLPLAALPPSSSR